MNAPARNLAIIDPLPDHTHHSPDCAVGYGHGSLKDAFHNARLQLDFVCVAVHAP